MPPRPNWKGYLKLSLVSCPIGLYPAVSAAEKISFRQVNRETGHRLRQQLVDSVTGQVVESHNKGRGDEVGENQFLMVQDEELDAAQQEARSRPFSAEPARAAVPRDVEEQSSMPSPPVRLVEANRREEAPPPIVPAQAPPPVRIENNRTIELDRFVPREQIDPRCDHTPYYIAPREAVGQGKRSPSSAPAMADSGLVGLGRVVLANRERPVMIEPMGSGLRGITLRYAHEYPQRDGIFRGHPQDALAGRNAADHRTHS